MKKKFQQKTAVPKSPRPFESNYVYVADASVYIMHKRNSTATRNRKNNQIYATHFHVYK